jgi:hypothetical protein
VPTISDEDAARAIKALEHYHAYLVAAKREDSAYQELADRLKRKAPEPEGQPDGYEAQEGIAPPDICLVTDGTLCSAQRRSLWRHRDH